MLITEDDLAAAREAIISAIDRAPDQFHGVDIAALPALVTSVAAAITTERHRVQKELE